LADSIIVLIAAELFDDDNDHAYSLAELGRAIAFAPRKDNAPIWRAFIRTRGNKFVKEVRTQRIRVRYQPRDIPREYIAG
jgi:hypothetical protein